MKKIVPIIISLVSGIFLFILCYDFQNNKYPNEYYNVYLDGEYLGSVLSRDELENYINTKTNHMINIKKITKTYCDSEIESDEAVKLLEKSVSSNYYDIDEKHCVDITIEDGQMIEKVYTPNGLEIEKVLAYKKDVTSIPDIYSKIVSIKSFTMKGYQFTLTNEENDRVTKVYTTDESVFENAIKLVIETYVGKDEYESYLLNTQKQIVSTGKLLENVYVAENITVKEKQIPINEIIYTSSNDLAQFLLYGNDPVSKTYTVKEGEMISDIAYNNEISSQEFLISNPKYKDVNALVKEGSVVSIKQTNPQIKVVAEIYSVEDKESEFKTIYQYDKTIYKGTDKVTQKGENGLERVSQRLKIENGVTVYVEPKGKETLKPSVDKIIVKGDKEIPYIGEKDWAWPTQSGWTSTSGYEWRIHPITGIRSFHYGIDIAGTGYNSDIYAANNGIIITKVAYHYSFGNYIVIDHNNGYYTLYAHMNKFVPGLEVGDTVAKGQLIGYVGSTGQSTGPHLHFEVWKGCSFCRINPWSIYR